MASLTINGISDELMGRLRKLAEKEGRSLNQQVIITLEQAIEERPAFSDLYTSFMKTSGPSPLAENDLDVLRLSDEGRSFDW